MNYNDESARLRKLMSIPWAPLKISSFLVAVYFFGSTIESVSFISSALTVVSSYGSWRFYSYQTYFSLTVRRRKLIQLSKKKEFSPLSQQVFVEPNRELSNEEKILFYTNLRDCQQALDYIEALKLTHWVAFNAELIADQLYRPINTKRAAGRDINNDGTPNLLINGEK